MLRTARRPSSASNRPVATPLGTRGNQKSIELLPASPPRMRPERTLLQKIGHWIAKRQAPSAVRLQHNRQKASDNTHRAMGELLTALARGPLAQQAIDKHLGQISKASRPLTKSDPDRVKAVYAQCLREQLDKLTSEQLAKLRQHVARADAGPDAGWLRHFDGQVHAALLRKDPNIAKALTRFDAAFQAFQAGDLVTMEDQLAQATVPAVMRLQGNNFAGLDAEWVARGDALLKEIFALWLLTKPVGDDEIVRFFMSMPAPLQARWQNTPGQHLSLPEAEVNRLLHEAIRQTEAELNQALLSACQAVTAAPSSGEQADQLDAVAQAWTALKTYCAAFQRPPSNIGAIDALKAVIQRTAGSLDLSSLGPSQLSTRQLGKLDQALQALEIAHDSQAIADEIARRKTDSAQPYLEAMEQALTHLASGDLRQALSALYRADGFFTQLVTAHRALGERFNDVQAQVDLANALWDQLLQAALPQALEQAFERLNDPQTLLVAQVLIDTGLRFPDLPVMAQVGQTLSRLKGYLSGHLGKEQEPRSLSPENARIAADLLDNVPFDIAQRFTGGRIRRQNA